MPKLFGHSIPKKLSWRKILDAGKVASMEPQRPDSPEAITWRLKCLRYAISKENQTNFAVQLNIESKRWNNLERGHPLSKEVALMIVQKWPDISLDWLFRGKDDHLPVWRQRQLIEAGKALTSAEGARSRSKTKVG